MKMEAWVKPFIAIVFLLLMCASLWTMTLYYLVGFKKGKKENKYKAYYFNKKLLSISFILLSINAICSLAGIAMIAFRNESFGLTLLWTFCGLAAASFLAEAVYSWLTYKYIFIGLEEEKIQFWGEKVLCRKITEIVKLEDENKLFIFFKYGERNLRKEKLALNSTASSFLIENLHALNFKVLDEISEETKALMNKKSDSEPSNESTTDAKPLATSSDDNKIVEPRKKEEKPKTKKVAKQTEIEINEEKSEENKK